MISCIGDEAIVVAGEAKGRKDIVIGKHGGIEHVLVDFKPETLKKLVLGDRILVKDFGLGLKLINIADIKVMNMDPCFFGGLGS